jgi:hypothetical protein
VTDVPVERIRVPGDPERIDAYYSNLKDLIKMLDSGDFNSFHCRETHSQGSQGHDNAFPNGCSCHGSELFLSIVREEQILSVFIPPDTSNQTRPLDLGVLDPMK